MQIKDRIFGANIDKKVIEKIKALGGGGLSGNEGDELSERKPTFEKYLGEKTPFARMWTAVNTFQTGSNIPAGSETFNNLVYIINSNRENSYDQNPNDQVQEGTNYRSQLEHNPYLKPSAGITSVMSKTEGSLGVIKKTSVEFIVHNKRDFETIFLPFFLRPGARVCIDFGWSDENTDRLYDPVEQVTNEDLKMQSFDRFIYGGVEPDGKEVIGFVNNPQNKGLVNVVMGDVVNYDAKLTEQGSFQCTLEIISRNTVLLDKSVDEENGLKFLFTNFIEDYLLQMFIFRMGEVGEVGVNPNLIPKKIDPFKTIVAEEARKKVFDQLSTPGKTTGIINSPFLQLGFFYQDLSNDPDDSAGANEREIIYISYGLFEDFFLNNIVVNFKDADNSDDEGINLKSQVKYSSKGSFVRYVTELVELQKLPLNDTEPLPTFLYPDNWEKSYNEKTRPDEEKIKYDGTDGVIPIRELFISVPLIQESFASSNNVNDALVSIFGAINEDSFDIINIQMTTNNNSDTSIGFQDINLLPELKPDEELIFDVTGPTSIVKTADLSFKTPKSGLSSMIAIQNLSSPSIFTQGDLANFNMLNILKEDKNPSEKTVIRSLPISSNDGKNIEASSILGSVDLQDFIQNNTTGNISSANFKGEESGVLFFKDNKDIKNLSSDIADYYKAVEEAQVGDLEEEQDDKKDQPANRKEYEVGEVNSKREQHGTRARLKYLLQSGTSTIAPVLPVELSLSVYGNNYLSVGDYFNINFLPSHYKDRVFFQVIGIEHKIGAADWETSYTTVMRIRPNKKKVGFGPENESDKILKIVIPASKEMTKSELENKTTLTVDDANIDTIVENNSIGMVFADIAKNYHLSKKTVSIKDTIGAKKITKKYNPHVLQFNFIQGKTGYATVDNLAMIYALTTMFRGKPLPDAKNEYRLNMDFFEESDYAKSLTDFYRKSRKASSMRGNDGKSLLAYRTSNQVEILIDRDFDKNFLPTDTDMEKSGMRFVEDLTKDFSDIPFIEDDILPSMEKIMYNLNSEDEYYQIEINPVGKGEMDTVIIVPRLMMKTDFGQQDAIDFGNELAKRKKEFEIKFDAILYEYLK